MSNQMATCKRGKRVLIPITDRIRTVLSVIPKRSPVVLTSSTPNQIKAITGHTTLKEVSRYTQKADQKRIAAEALRTIEAQIVPPKSAHLKLVGGNEEKPQ